MRIAFVVTGGFDRSDRERVVPALLWLAERLARRHDVHVFALHHYPAPATYRLRGATIHDIGRAIALPGLRRWHQRRRLAHAISQAGRFDVLHAYLGGPGIVAAPLAARLRIPFVLTLDSGELVALPDIEYGLQRRAGDRRDLDRAMDRAARIIVSTEFMARQPALRGREVAVVPLGVDAAFFPVAGRADGPPWRLIRVASLNRVKDYPLLIDALQRVRAHGLDASLDAVGEDTMHGSMQALAHARGLDGHISFHGFQPTDRLASLYARAHLHIVSSRHEAASVAVLEAACTGLATVGTRVGYVADWTPDRAEAIGSSDPDALANAIIGLLRDPVRRERLSSAARTWALAHDAGWTAAQIERIYERVAAEPR